MTADDAPAVVRAYHQTWTSKNFDEAIALLSPALKVEAPINDYPTKESFAKALTGFGRCVSSSISPSPTAGSRGSDRSTTPPRSAPPASPQAITSAAGRYMSGPGPATITRMPTLEVETPQGLARAHVHAGAEPRAALALGHGAAGGVASEDLVAVMEVALSEGLSVVLVEQPYRVAGRRSPPPARQLDAAWTAVIDYLVAGELRGLPLLVGGRSLGARVACRTAAATGAVAVLCLAFPLQPPSRSGPARASRLSELDEVTVPTLVVQGSRDPFGMPPAAERRTVVQVPGDHRLRTDLEAVAAAVRSWLPTALGHLVKEKETG